jgi:hypothetical protein
LKNGWTLKAAAARIVETFSRNGPNINPGVSGSAVEWFLYENQATEFH